MILTKRTLNIHDGTHHDNIHVTQHVNNQFFECHYRFMISNTNTLPTTISVANAATISTSSMIAQTVVATDSISQGMWYALRISKFVIIIMFLDIVVTQVYGSLSAPRSLAHTYADSVVVGTFVACALLLLLVTLMVIIGYFILKVDTIKKGVPAVMSS